MRQFLRGIKSDESLMLDYGRGDSAAFEVLYMRHKDSLFAFLYRHCPQQAVVEDLAHDAWTAVIRSAPRYQPSAKFRTWLYQIAHNRLVDHWRRPQPEELLPESVAHEGGSAEAQHRAYQLMQLVLALPSEQKDAFLLREQGFSYREIAEITATGKETVKSRLRYATASLRQQLGGAYD
jgi:RNA polymerase sigma-70 factor (ECF subfamily)